MPSMRMEGLQPFQVPVRLLQYLLWIFQQSCGNDLVVGQAAAVFAGERCNEPDFELQTHCGGQPVNRPERWRLRPGLIGSDGRL